MFLIYCHQLLGCGFFFTFLVDKKFRTSENQLQSFYLASMRLFMLKKK